MKYTADICPLEAKCACCVCTYACRVVVCADLALSPLVGSGVH